MSIIHNTKTKKQPQSPQRKNINTKNTISKKQFQITLTIFYIISSIAFFFALNNGFEGLAKILTFYFPVFKKTFHTFSTIFGLLSAPLAGILIYYCLRETIRR